jgi:putative transposase
MILVEQHIIKQNKQLDDLTFKCKNLYNKANYIIRQEFINNGRYISIYDMYVNMKDDENYIDIGNARIARGVLRTLDGNWKGFFATIKDWTKNKSKYNGKPNLPNYLNKKGKFNAIFTDGSFRFKNDKLKLSTLKDLEIQTKLTAEEIIEINIRPLKTGKYKASISYNKQEQQLKKDNGNYCSIDLGVNNLMTLTSNKQGLRPLLINGRPLKSINQYYNKKLSLLKQQLPFQDKSLGNSWYLNKKTGDKVLRQINSSKKINLLTEKREFKINDYLHKASHFLINWCLNNELNTIIIGYNQGWKGEVNLGKRVNQNFVNIPYYKLINMIIYKAKLNGLSVKLTDEAYTSKCSSLDFETIEKHEQYKGTRICRGLYINSEGKLINADVNGSLNILRKVIPNQKWNGIEDNAVYPKTIKCFK